LAFSASQHTEGGGMKPDASQLMALQLLEDDDDDD
jgi:hypothetical protein